jgi:flagellar biogenesis protein FliO
MMDGIGQAAAVIGVLALLGAGLHWLRRGPVAWPRNSSGRRLESLERLSLTPQHTLHLVRVGERTLLVSASPAGCAVLESGQAAGREPVSE